MNIFDRINSSCPIWKILLFLILIALIISITDAQDDSSLANNNSTDTNAVSQKTPNFFDVLLNWFRNVLGQSSKPALSSPITGDSPKNEVQVIITTPLVTTIGPSASTTLPVRPPLVTTTSSSWITPLVMTTILIPHTPTVSTAKQTPVPTALVTPVICPQICPQLICPQGQEARCVGNCCDGCGYVCVDAIAVTPQPTPTPTHMCKPPVCPYGQVLQCPGTCYDGCGYVCAILTAPTTTPWIPTPTPACTLPVCEEYQVLYCPGTCSDGCGYVCLVPTTVPTPIPTVKTS